MEGRGLESLTPQEALELKYRLLRAIDVLEDRTNYPGTEYRRLLKQIYIMEYCFFDNHFVRGKDGILLLNENLTAKTIEHPEDIKKAFCRIYADFAGIDNNNRRWLQRHYGVIFRS